MEWLANGIKAGWTYVTDKFTVLAQKIRDYFPFSPAKTGALKDLHKTKIVETVANSIKPRPLINAVNGTVQALANYAGGNYSGRPLAATTPSGHTVHINYSPTITIAGNANAADFAAQLKQHSKEIAKIIDDAFKNKTRTKF